MLKKAKEWLEENGVLSSSFLMQKLKLKKEEAQNMLKRIAKKHPKARFKNENIICIQDYDPLVSFRKLTNKWKDVTRP